MRVVYSPKALARLNALYEYIWVEASERTADWIVSELTARCESLAEFPERGAPPDEIRERARILPFPRGVIAYVIEPGEVRIVDILYGGQSMEGAFED